MTMPGLPPERQSLYPEPYAAGGWDPTLPTRRSRGWIIPLVAAGLAVVALATWGGIEVGHAIGTASVSLHGGSPQSINAIQAKAGTCLQKLPANGTVATVNAISCSVPHEAEVVAEYPFTGNQWPGRDAAASTLLGFCRSFVQPGYSDSSMFTTPDWNNGLRWVAWAPTERSWASNQRTGVCVVYRDRQITGSFMNSSATFVN
jgi:hypothetical protein